MSENKNVSKGGDKKPVVTVAKGGSSDKPKKKETEPVEPTTIVKEVKPESPVKPEAKIEEVKIDVEELRAQVKAELLAEQEAQNKTDVKENTVIVNKASSAKTVRFKFAEQHSFNIGTKRIEAKKGDIMPLELHIANKLTARKLGYIL